MTKKLTNAEKSVIIEALLKKFLLITFTNSASKEMRDRVAGAFLEKGYEINPSNVQAMTFNAIYMNIIAKYYEELGYKKIPQVIDVNPVGEASKVVPLITGENKIQGLNYSIPIEFYISSHGGMGALVLALKVFSLMREKNTLSFDDVKEVCIKEGLYNQMSDESIKDLIARFDEYVSILKDEGYITFQDQETLSSELLEKHPEYLENLGCKYLVVDEFQDSNDVNMEFVKKMSDYVPSLMCIGDAKQSIYKFRNAVVENMTRFKEKIGKKNVTELSMSENYRSYEEITEPANTFIKLNRDGQDDVIISKKGKGGSYTLKAFHMTDKEYEYIADNAIELFNKDSEKTTAIIARTKAELIKIQNVLVKKGAPVILTCPVKAIEDSRVIAGLAITKAFYEPECLRNYIIYLNALCMETYNESVKVHFKTNEELLEAIKPLKGFFLHLDEYEPEKVYKKLHELLDAINFGEIYDKWLTMVYDNERNVDSYEDKVYEDLTFIKNFERYGKNTEIKMDGTYSNAIILTTAHSSKGLEYDNVFLTVTKFDMPILHKFAEYDEVEEARRLIFVAMTRAKENLFVTGQYLITKPTEHSDGLENQFLKELYINEGLEWDSVDHEAIEREIERLKAKKEEALAKRKAKNKALLDGLDADDDKTLKASKSFVDSCKALKKTAKSTSKKPVAKKTTTKK